MNEGGIERAIFLRLWLGAFMGFFSNFLPLFTTLRRYRFDRLLIGNGKGRFGRMAGSAMVALAAWWL
jgi:hypothetical protein